MAVSGARSSVLKYNHSMIVRRLLLISSTLLSILHIVSMAILYLGCCCRPLAGLHILHLLHSMYRDLDMTNQPRMPWNCCLAALSSPIAPVGFVEFASFRLPASQVTSLPLSAFVLIAFCASPWHDCADVVCASCLLSSASSVSSRSILMSASNNVLLELEKRVLGGQNDYTNSLETILCVKRRACTWKINSQIIVACS